MKHRFITKLSAYGALALLAALPLAASAQRVMTQELQDFLIRIGAVITALTLIVSGLAVLFFIYGLVRFIANAGEEERRKEGKKAMGWGIIALFVMVSLWGIVTLIRSSVLGTGKAGTIKSMPPPTIDSPYFGDENELQ